MERIEYLLSEVLLALLRGSTLVHLSGEAEELCHCHQEHHDDQNDQEDVFGNQILPVHLESVRIAFHIVGGLVHIHGLFPSAFPVIGIPDTHICGIVVVVFLKDVPPVIHGTVIFLGVGVS